eukprot:m.117711 g.117711  ORF g.117711 m.117711 type:complete len:84 (-) comp14257_c0_seq2:69-320(-)
MSKASVIPKFGMPREGEFRKGFPFPFPPEESSEEYARFNASWHGAEFILWLGLNHDVLQRLPTLTQILVMMNNVVVLYISITP